VRCLVPALLAALAAAAASSAPDPLRVRASPVVAPCVAAAAVPFERATGRSLRVETAPLESPASAASADVVVGADAELTRIVESGVSHPDLEVDVARIPWVLVGTPSAARVRVPGGVVGRQARRSLEGVASSRLASLPAGGVPPRLASGEAAVVPLSLAGPGPVSSVSIPPLTVRALGVRASAKAEAARAFLEFLASGPGNEAFRACGRTEGP
jgi:hypothetical protein